MTRSDNNLPVHRGSNVVSSIVEREIKLAIDRDFHLPPLPGATAPALSTLAAFDLNQQEELRALAAQLAARCGIPVQES